MRVLVTGASRGIGRAVASALLQRGDTVALAVRDPASVAPLLAAAPGSVALPVELRRQDEVATLVARACAALGGIDGLVNCAGIVRYTASDLLERDELMEQLEVNFIAPLTLCQHAANAMRAAGSGGAIVNLASTLALKPAPLTAAYASSKAALIAWTRTLALEYGAERIRVNAVAPGIVDTDMIRVIRGTTPTAADAQKLEAQLDELRKLHVLGRLGTAQEVADAVLYLLSAKFVTGSVLVIDGGLTLA
jgi:NAD(P)-dependent dehydrogenase (short-subunit alcohol dehydrogenase family)